MKESLAINNYLRYVVKGVKQLRVVELNAGDGKGLLFVDDIVKAPLVVNGEVAVSQAVTDRALVATDFWGAEKIRGFGEKRVRCGLC